MSSLKGKRYAEGKILHQSAQWESNLAMQLFNQCRSRFRFDVKIVESNPSFRIDNDCPGGAAGTIICHDLRRKMVLWISGRMGHGDIHALISLILMQFLFRGVAVALKNGLHCQKHHTVVAVKSLG